MFSENILPSLFCKKKFAVVMHFLWRKVCASFPLWFVSIEGVTSRA